MTDSPEPQLASSRRGNAWSRPGCRCRTTARCPRFRPETWRLSVVGATARGCDRHLEVEEFDALPTLEVVADMHCVTRWTSLQNAWAGIAGRTLLELVPPARGVTHVMAWAEFGYSATIRLEDFAAPGCVLATHLNGKPLSPERGWPLRLVSRTCTPGRARSGCG